MKIPDVDGRNRRLNAFGAALPLLALAAVSCSNLPSWWAGVTPTRPGLFCPRRAHDADPSRHVERGEPKTEHIDKVVGERHGLLNGCYSDLMARIGTSVQGRVDVRFRIERNGTLEGTCILETELNDQELSACVLDAFKGLRFEASAATTTVTYPVYFSLDPLVPSNGQPPLLINESRAGIRSP